uniref:Serine protease n=1 Tax=Eupolyphaga sinensis TaxID=367774 RepID=G9B5L5_9NEOP|nr:serine protease [Eupolyphaga sinensis]
MKLSTIIIALVLGCLGAQAAPPDPRLIGGSNVAQIADYPWVVSVIKMEGENIAALCIGTIVDETHFIIPAHCKLVSDDNYSTYRVRSNTLTYNGTQATTHEITSWIQHEGYDENTKWTNDISLVTVATEFAANVSAPLAAANAVDPADEATVTSVGWGATCDGCEFNLELQSVADLRIYSQTNCNAFLGEGLNANKVCAGNPSTQHGICKGDSGAPLIENEIVIGIASYLQYLCGSAPAVYTKISKFRTWIDDTIASQLTTTEPPETTTTEPTTTTAPETGQEK